MSNEWGTQLNCQSSHGNGCGRCMTCRLEYALSLIQQELELTKRSLTRHVDRIADELGVISERVEEM